MTSKSTPDERFLIKLYEMAFATGNPLAAMKIQTVATAIGQKETAIKNIIKHLAQANFLIKVDETRVALTERGCAFVLNLSQ
jgi:Mn-dependent DtxR family transcriptional regulator